jgi:hypothetical protein
VLQLEVYHRSVDSNFVQGNEGRTEVGSSEVVIVHTSVIDRCTAQIPVAVKVLSVYSHHSQFN